MSETDGGNSNSYREEVDSRIDDGGGCCEVWEAMSSIRDDATDVTSHNRRDVLKRVAVSAIFGGVGIASSGAASAKQPSSDGTIQTLEGDEKEDAIEEAMSASKVETLREEIDRFKSVDRSNSIVKRLQREQSQRRQANDTQEGLIVRLVFESGENASIIWSDQESVGVLGIAETQVDGTRATLNYHFEAAKEDEEEQLVKSKVIHTEDGRKIVSPTPVDGDSGEVSTEQTGGAVGMGPCGSNQRLVPSCLEKTIETNPETTQACSMCVAAIQTGVSIVGLTTCGWCAYDIFQNGWDQPCDLCESNRS